MFTIWHFIERYWLSIVLVGIVVLAVWRVYARWYRLKVW